MKDNWLGLWTQTETAANGPQVMLSNGTVHLTLSQAAVSLLELLILKGQTWIRNLSDAKTSTMERE